jgi:hypothetical protein
LKKDVIGTAAGDFCGGLTTTGFAMGFFFGRDATFGGAECVAIISN